MKMTPNRKSKERQEFYDEILKYSMTPLWEVFHSLVTNEPDTPIVPVRWRYNEVRPYLMRSGELISAEEAERRVLVLENPGLPGQSSTTRTLYAGLQLIMPGEIAQCHRHTQGALRFIIEGDGAYTSVEGERAVMSEWDLVLTPSWEWHDHGNESDHPMVWLDGLDIPTIRFFDAGFAEKSRDRLQQVLRPPGDSLARYGANMLPVGFTSRGSSPVFHYPYSEYREALSKMSRTDEWDPHLGLKMEFINPEDGGPVMPTIAAFVQMLPKGFSTPGYRTTEGMVITVVEGAGRVNLGNQSFDLKPRDIYVVPSWCVHTYTATEDMLLFIISDRGMQSRLGIWREKRDAA